MLVKISIIILIIAVITVVFVLLRRRKFKADLVICKHEPTITTDLDYELTPETITISIAEEITVPKFKAKSQPVRDTSPYDPNTVVLQLRAAPGKPYMGYELLQTMLAAGLRFGEMNIFHYYADPEAQQDALFSVAAATADGAFAVNDMGAFSCNGLVMFLRLNKTKEAMKSFELMLETAQQLVEDLGGDIFDELQQPLDDNAILRLRDVINKTAHK